MTDRLALLLHDEVDALAVPPAPSHSILRTGRRLRRRRRGSAVLAAAAVVAVAAGGFRVMYRSDPPSTFAPVPHTGRLAPGTDAISLNDLVFLDDGRRHVQVPDRVAGLLYTSAGLLVRTSATGNTGTGAPYGFTLVGRHGETDRLDLTVDGGGLDAVPSQPYLVRSEVHDGVVAVVVDDVATDHEVARVELPGGLSWRAHSATPPVSLDGDTVYVATTPTAYAVTWRSGLVTPAPALGPDSGPVRGGHVVGAGGRRVLDVATGRTLLRVPGHDGTHGYLSPDGRFLAVPGAPSGGTYLYDVATGRRHRVDTYLDSWTPDGHAFGETYYGHEVLTLCAPASGHCRQIRLHAYDRALRAAGTGAESIISGHWFS